MFIHIYTCVLYFNRLAPVSRRPRPPMHRSTWCNPWQSLVCCFPLQKFFTFFFVHHPSRIKNPRNRKHPQFHPVIHGNTRLRHPILFPFRPRTHEVDPPCFWKLAPNFHDTGLETEARFPATPPSGNRSPFWAGRGGNRASDLLLTSLSLFQLGQVWAASTAIHLHLLHSHRLRPPQTQTPKSKIQNPNGPFGFWILDFGFWIFGSWILDLGFWILDFGSWILDFGFWILDFGSWILDFGFWILDLGFWILDFGSWILDFGFWIVVVSVLFVATPNAAVWILDFGFWILDFGFWILDFGFWILDFGFWILDFGFWILDFVFSARFGFCIRLFYYTPTRVGGLLSYTSLWLTQTQWP